MNLIPFIHFCKNHKKFLLLEMKVIIIMVGEDISRQGG
jgi:hypothetical protein